MERSFLVLSRRIVFSPFLVVTGLGPRYSNSLYHSTITLQSNESPLCSVTESDSGRSESMPQYKTHHVS